MNTYRFVSIIIPCRNESKFIGVCLDSIIINEYPKENLEILVVDGMSEDGTRGIVSSYSKRYSFIRLLDNPGKVTPFALNIGIRNAKGGIIIRMDAHAEYPNSYVSTCLEYLDKTGADVVGGPIITRAGADTLVARCIASATAHPFGVGNSRFRTSAREGYVDTVPFGAYRREVFDKVGLFNERLVRNQDNELSSRILKNGGKIYLTPRLKVAYYNQPTVRGLIGQALKTGMWNVVTLRVNHSAFRWRHFIPFAFVTALLILGLLGIFYAPIRYIFCSLIGLYAVLAMVSSFQIGLREGMKCVWILPIVFFLYHLSYGIGTYGGLVKAGIIDRNEGSDQDRSVHLHDKNQGGAL